MSEYPLYPTLTDEGKLEAQKIMDSFKPEIKALIDDLMSDLYTDVSYYVESDHWLNYRNAVLDGFKGYKENASAHPCEFKELRKAIYENNKDEIIKDLNQDLVNKISSLEKQVESLQELSRNRY